jgi:hypothetical protein
VAGEDISLGAHSDADHLVAMRTLLSFLLAAAESYRYSMYHRIPLSETENGTLFDERTTEWAYQNDSELQMAASELGDE